MEEKHHNVLAPATKKERGVNHSTLPLGEGNQGPFLLLGGQLLRERTPLRTLKWRRGGVIEMGKAFLAKKKKGKNPITDHGSDLKRKEKKGDTQNILGSKRITPGGT